MYAGYVSCCVSCLRSNICCVSSAYRLSLQGLGITESALDIRGLQSFSEPSCYQRDNAMATQPTAFASLPGSALLRIFQLVCDRICPPNVPGTCWVTPVCKQWRDLACSVKGLRVVYLGEQQQAADSFCAWLRRYVRQVVALGITSDDSSVRGVLAALAEEAAAATASSDEGAAEGDGTAAAPAAAAGGFLPLQRLVITDGELLLPQVCRGILQPLLAALPHLQYLHIPLQTSFRDHVTTTADEHAMSAAAAAALAPLQHSIGLTSLVLKGPWGMFAERVTDEAHAQLLSNLPPTLRSLEWHLEDLVRPGELSFGHLTGLTHLRLVGGDHNIHIGTLPDDAFTSLRELRRLELWGVRMSEEGLVAHKEQLVGLELSAAADVLPQLTHLQELQVLSNGSDQHIEGVLQQAPPLKLLYVELPSEEGDEEPSSTTWDPPWQLQHYTGLTQLQALALWYYIPPAAPLELASLTQLRQLDLTFNNDDPVGAASRVSWANALAGLVNVEVLRLPGELTDCRHPWLTRLTRLVVLDVRDVRGVTNTAAAAAAHISRLLAPGPTSCSSSSSSSSSSTQACMGQAPRQVRVVCIHQTELHKALVAVVPVLPPLCHLFSGSWRQLQQCGVELWPAPVAARLKELDS